MHWLRRLLWALPLSNGRADGRLGIWNGDAARWAVTYTSPLAARLSGTPLGIPLHPVQAYAGLAFLTLPCFAGVVCPRATTGRRGGAMPDGSWRHRFS